MNPPNRIIVRMPNWIGDLVMATPILQDLRKAFPQAEITAMCRSPLGELLKKDQSINEIFDFQRRKNNFSRRQARRDIVQKIREGNFDLGVLLTNSFSSAWLFWQGNVKKRLGFSYGIRRVLLNNPIPPPQDKMKTHQVEIYKRLLDPLGIEHSNSVPQLFVEEEEKREVQEMLKKQGYREGQRLIGINPGAAYGSAKCWPPERFHELAEKLSTNPDYFIIFFGDQSHLELVRKICRGLPQNVSNLAGTTNLRELMAAISLCDLLITNDSGPMHMGAALHVPLIALFGSTDDVLTGPYAEKQATVINKKADCSPCFKRTCPIDFRCMKQITVDEIATIAEQKLAKGKLHV